MHENPYQAPEVEAPVEKSTGGKPLPRTAAVMLAALSLIMAAGFVLTATSCFFDSIWRYNAPWNLDGDNKEVGMTVLFWSAIGFSTWAATAWAALRARKALVAAALIGDAAVFVSIALL